MKTIILCITTLFVANVYGQNTIPTTTCTGAMKINDSLNVNKDIMANGDITSKGEVTSTDTLRAKEDVIASKDIKVDGSVYVGDKLTVSGQSTFEQEMIVKKSLLFDGGNELSYTPSSNTARSRFYFGNSSAKPLPWFSACPSPNTITNYFTQVEVPGSFISRAPLGSGTGQTNASLAMFAAPWDGNGFIEIEGVDNLGQGNNGLYLNHFCGRNTHINTNWDITNGTGGTVFLGAKVDMQQSMRIGAAGSPIDLNTSIEIDKAQNNANVIKVNTSNPTVKVLSILRNDNVNTFVVYGDGKTQIGGDRVVYGPHTDAMLSVGGSGKIACKEVRVFNNASGYWADFVFDKTYKLLPLLEVEKYYTTNKHLPNIPTAKQIEENGNDLAKTDALLLQKIEELTMYIVQQQKEIEALKKEIKK